MTALALINNTPEKIKETDIDKLSIELTKHYDTNISKLAFKVFGASISNLAKRAFIEKSKQKIKIALSTFLFKKQHWKNGRNVEAYLLKSLKYLATEIYWQEKNYKRGITLICPLCKILFAKKAFLITNGENLNCYSCEFEIKKYEELKISNQKINDKIKLHKIFAFHSKKGYKCPECNMFIPKSISSNGNIACPFDNCLFFGNIHSLKEIQHPGVLATKIMDSLNVSALTNKDGKELSPVDLVKSTDINIENKLIVLEKFKKEYYVLIDVIEKQINIIKNTNKRISYYKKAMLYQAFKKIITKYPEESISYLVHLKQNTDLSIISLIFQEYISSLEEIMPFQIKKDGQLLDVISINDPNLSLFCGKSIFDGIVNEDNTIDNNTNELYCGEFKSYGSFFIGKLLNIEDENYKSLMNDVVNYSFANIKMNNNIKPGTKVKIYHYRIPPHYEMGHLIQLQRIRKQIVEKVFFRLNGKKRNT